MEGDKPLYTGEEKRSAFFQETKESATAPASEVNPISDPWLVAEPDPVYPQRWVESKFGKGHEFTSIAECNKYIRLNPDIDNLVKVGLKPKRKSDLAL